MDITYYKKYEPIFGEWSIVREIGEGSFGKVFEIERRDFGYTYKAALKAITIPQSRSEIERIADDGMGPESVTAYFRGFVQELVEEFRIMSKLKGESNIVSYEDHRVIEHTDEIGWDVFIRMELLTPLTKYAKEHGISRADVIRLGIDICSALELCRKNNIIHRDIKPENIFVSENGKFKLGDFGIAKTVEKTTGGLSKKGTYTYMAPEVYKGEAYGASVDIYSLGIVLYRFMNNNRTPFLPSYPTPIKYADRESAMARRIKGETIPAPANADEALSRVILKACAYKPEERYRSAADMRRDLEALLGEDEQQPDLDKTVGVFSGKGTAKVDAPAAAPNATEEAEALAETDSSNIKVPLAATEVGTVGVFSAYGSADGPLFMDEVPVQLPTVVESAKAETPANPPEPKNSPVKKPVEQPKEKAVKLPKEKNKKKTLIIAASLLLVVLAAIGIMAVQSRTYIIAVSAGYYHTVGLRSDGTVAATGGNNYGQCNVSGWTDIVSVSAGEEHTVGLRSDGTVVATGDNNYGQCNVSGWTDIVSVSAGFDHTVGLRSDGTVVATGENNDGQCNVSGWTDIVSVSAGFDHTVGLRSDGTVVATGWTENGQYDVSGWTDIVSVSAGGQHTVGLRSDGTVVATGWNEYGQCNVSAWTDIVSVSAGFGHTVGLRSDGTVVATGLNENGQCDVTGWTDIVSVSAGEDHTVGLRSNGIVVATGENYDGQCDVTGWTGIAAILNPNRIS